MARTKLKRLHKVNELPNVFNYNMESLQTEMQDYFKSAKHFTLEIGCGHGDYSVELAKKFPERYFIGIDVKGARIYHGAMRALEEKLNNVAFIISKAENLNEFIPPNSVQEIIIPFPDPQFRRANQKRRLISPDFLKIYKGLLISNGVIHLKTDNQSLFDYTVDVIKNFGCEILFLTEDLNYNKDNDPLFEIVTRFEEHYIKEGRKIKYIRFKF